MGGLRQCCTANWPCAPISLDTTGMRKHGPIGAPCGPGRRPNARVRRTSATAQSHAGELKSGGTRATGRGALCTSCNGGQLQGFSSGANRDRTGDLLLAKQALSQLSYGPAGAPSVAAGRVGAAKMKRVRPPAPGGAPSRAWAPPVPQHKAPINPGFTSVVGTTARNLWCIHANLDDRATGRRSPGRPRRRRPPPARARPPRTAGGSAGPSRRPGRSSAAPRRCARSRRP